MLRRRLSHLSIRTRLLLLSLIGLACATNPAYASAPAKPIRQDSYPPSIQESESYPAPNTNPASDFPMPAGAPTGQQADLAVTAESIQQPGNEGSSGMLLLWLSFLAAFLIFLASIIGSVLLFARRNDG